MRLIVWGPRSQTQACYICVVPDKYFCVQGEIDVFRTNDMHSVMPAM